ncbi:MAG: DUF1287 domain-containing protein [Deltaproteobacteria bacterium]
MKKHKKRKSQARRHKVAASPLPLDVSRSHRPRATRTREPPHPAPGLLSVLRPEYSLNAIRPLSLWKRLTGLTASQRADLAMLSLPFLLIGLSIGVARWTEAAHGNRHLATLAPFGKHALFGLPPAPAPVVPAGPDRSVSARTLTPGQVHAEVWQPSTTTSARGPSFDPVTIGIPAPEKAASMTADRSLAEAAPDEARTNDGKPAGIAATSGDAPEKSLQTASPIEETAQPASGPIDMPPANPPAPELASIDVPGGLESLSGGPSQCFFVATPPPARAPVTWKTSDPESFGLALAAAARRQLEDFVIYNDRYTRMKYPMGDVHPMYGVCTDVIIRAYRALGIDLQELVQTTKTGSGDPNIDHRRVDTLRKFFSRFGESLAISTFAEDYRPGDIVTYWRPQNRHSRTHIAIVSDQTAPSGRPLIIHNRGWGPQQEDGLFVDEITGHYRFSGMTIAATGSNKQASKGARSMETSTLRDVVKASR